MPLQAGTVADHLGRAWERRFPQADRKPDWAALLEPRHLQMWILRVVVAYDDVTLAGLPVAAGAGPVTAAHLLPGMASVLPRELRPAVRRRLADPETWAVVAALGATASTLATAVRASIGELPPAERPATTMHRVSEWACKTVTRPYRHEPALPSQAYLVTERAEFVAAERARAMRTRALVSEVDFANRYAPVYDELWERLGHAALDVLHPVELGLGRLPRPPMTAKGNGWRAGTDQAVRVRYRYYLRTRWGTDPAAVVRVAGLPEGQHLSERLGSADPDAVCRGELRRVCSPIGLCFPQHHQLCRAFGTAVADADLQTAFDTRGDHGRFHRGTALQDWAAERPELPQAADPALVSAVRTYAEYWAHRGARTEELVNGIRSDWPTQIRLGAARKLWHVLHHREIEWEAPLVRAETAELLPKMFGHHLNTLKLAPVTDQDDQDAAPLDMDDPRLQAVLAALDKDAAAAAELVAQIVQNDPDWELNYKRLMAGSARVCLTAAEFHRWAVASAGLPDTGEE